ncbi:MAG: hypothetical protein QXU40_03505 [Candidatus Pacearchaeota archaeon]
MFKKRMSKRAQTEVSLGTMLLLILGIVALVIVIIGFTSGWNYIFSSIGLLPDDLTKMAVLCKEYAGIDALKVSYCEFKEGRIQGKKGWYNCKYVYDVLSDVRGGGAVDFSRVDCNESLESIYCNNLRKSLGDKSENIIVNGKKCSEW